MYGALIDINIGGQGKVRLSGTNHAGCHAVRYDEGVVLGSPIQQSLSS